MSHAMHGVMPGVVTPNEKAPGVGITGGLESNSTHTADSNTTGVTGKEISTQIAKLALAGHAVYRLEDGSYFVSKYGYSYHAKDFEDLQAFAIKLGVK